MLRFVLNSEEIACLRALLAAIVATYESAEDPDFLLEASVFAHELPRSLRAALNSFG